MTTTSYPNLKGQTMVTTTVQSRRTIAVDFDGVLHQWDGTWKGYHVIEGEEVPGAIEWLNDMARHYEVVILTTRGLTWRGRRAVRRWLQEHSSLKNLKVTAKKVPALVYIDDRAMRFDGKNWPSAERIRGARPWWKS